MWIGGHIPVLLSQIVSLEELSINFSYASVIEPEVWINIDRQLGRLQLSNLRRLNVVLNPNLGANDEAFIEEKLTSCDGRGIIRFC